MSKIRIKIDETVHEIEVDYLFDGFTARTAQGNHGFIPLPGENDFFELIPSKKFMEMKPLDMPPSKVEVLEVVEPTAPVDTTPVDTNPFTFGK